MKNSTDSRGNGILGEGGKVEIVQVWRFLAAAVVVVAHAYSRIARVFPESISETMVFALKLT